MTVIFLFFSLLILLWYSYLTSKGKLLSPQFGFALSFVPQIFLAIFYIRKWNLNLSLETCLVLLGGILLFILVSISSHYILTGKSKCTSKNKIKYHDNVRQEVASWKMISFIVFQLFTLLLLVRYLLSLSPRSTLISAILYYRYTNLFSENTFRIPGIIRMMRTICVSSGYIWLYVLIRSVIYKDKTKRLYLIINVALSLINDIILGSRTGIAIIIVCGAVQYYFISGKKNGWKKAISFSTVLWLMIIVFAFITSFQTLAKIMQRTLASEYNFMDYIAGYLSAPMKNLDVFIKKGIFGSTIETNQTLNGIIPLISEVFSHPEWVHKLDLPFVYEGGYNYGNVYTIFYPFLYDLGYFGVILYISIMAFICQIIYTHALKSDDSKIISLSIVVYSYIYFTILFSFFSDKFFETVVNTKFLWTVISWIVLERFINFGAKTKRKN